MKLLDLFCGAGGASVGYSEAGFDVTGVDINIQPNYPFKSFKADAMDFPLDGFDVIHASPPCQRYALASNSHDRTAYPDLIAETRRRLQTTKAVWIIENVERAPLINPVLLCGSMFSLGVIRHRLFESNIPMRAPGFCWHRGTVANGEYVRVVGHGGGLKHGTSDFATWQEAMQIDWMNRKELTQAIPPAYTRWLGMLAMDYLGGY